jgi:glycerophosphoryl diester phosphodiesterase
MPGRVRENTLPSFAAALDAGADGIELDVHATADGVVVVHHDPCLRGGMEITRATWSEISHLGKASGLEVPTLADVCELVADRADLYVEIKGVGIGEDVLRVLAGHRGPHAVHSFDHEAIARLARSDDPPPLGLLFERAVPDVPALLASHGARDAWPHHSLVDARLVTSVHDAGGRVIAWTANQRAQIARLTALGVDGICTDDVTLIGAA